MVADSGHSEIFQQKNLKARTIVYDHTYANKGLNFAANQGETPDVPQVAVINFMKTDITNGYDYEKAENSLNSGLQNFIYRRRNEIFIQMFVYISYYV